MNRPSDKTVKESAGDEEGLEQMQQEQTQSRNCDALDSINASHRDDEENQQEEMAAQQQFEEDPRPSSTRAGAYAVNQQGMVRRGRVGDRGDDTISMTVSSDDWETVIHSENDPMIPPLQPPNRDTSAPLVEAQLAESTENRDEHIARLEQEITVLRSAVPLAQTELAHDVDAEADSQQVSNTTSNHEEEERKIFSNRFILLGCVLLIVVAVIAIPTALASTNQVEPSTTKTPTFAPTQQVIPGSWQAVGQVLHGKASDDHFGTSISLSRDGTIVAVGAEQASSSNPGYVLVYRLGQSTLEWTRIGQELVGGGGGDEFGKSVALNGNGTILAVGSDEHDSGGDNAGHVRVFEYNSDANRWAQLGSDILGQAANDRFGISVSLSDAGEVLAVGALHDDTENGVESGSVRIFQYNRTSLSWNQLGQTLIGQATGDEFGLSVSLNAPGDVVGVGARYSDSGGSVAVYEFNLAASRWEPLGHPIIGQVDGGLFGSSLSLDDSGLVITVGSPGCCINSKGRVLVYSYSRETLTWEPHGQQLLTQQPGDYFGWSASLSGNGNIVAVASRSHNVNGLTAAGQVTMFQYDTNSSRWNQLGNTLYGKNQWDYFGWSVSLSADGRVIGVGARLRDVNGESSGSAYMFALNN